MGTAVTINPVTPLLAGAAKAKTTVTTAETVYIAPTTAQSVLDFSKLAIIVENIASATTTITVGAGDDFSEVNVGNNAAITLGTAASATGQLIIGGASFESARFQDSDGYVTLTLPSTANVYISAVMLP